MNGSVFFKAYLQRRIKKIFGINRRHLLIAAMPKSASSFLLEAVAFLPGMEKIESLEFRGRTEQELDELHLASHVLRNYVAKYHLRFSEGAAQQIHRYGIKPIVLFRNLYDCAVSLRDHFRNDHGALSMAWVDPRLIQLDDESFEAFIADCMPWFVHFYVSWKHYPDALWISYNEIKDEPEAVLSRIVRYAGIAASDEDVRAAVDASRVLAPRFNKGIGGRGSTLSDYARKRINTLVSYYPDVDFSPVL